MNSEDEELFLDMLDLFSNEDYQKKIIQELKINKIGRWDHKNNQSDFLLSKKQIHFLKLLKRAKNRYREKNESVSIIKRGVKENARRTNRRNINSPLRT